MTVPVVQKTKHAVAGSRHEKIKKSIPVDIGKNSAPAEPIRANNAGILRDIFELQSA